MRGDKPSTSATLFAPIESSEQCVGIGCGCWREHSTEGSETASGVSADLGVDSARRYHMRPVADKPTCNKSSNLEQGISSRMGGGKSVIDVNGTAA